MKTEVTDQQVESYQSDGFLIHRGLLPPDELARVVEELASTVDTMGKHLVAGDGNKDLTDDVFDEFYRSSVFQRINLWRINAVIKELFQNDGVGRMLCRLAGIDGIRVFHDQTIQKRPWGNPTAWHYDNSFWSFFSDQAMTMWIALTPATVENGCLWYLPGSHKMTSRDKNTNLYGDNKNFGALFELYPEMAAMEPVPAVLEPGDAVIHNAMTAHAAGVNNTPGWRRAWTCAFMPEGSVYNGRQNVLSKDYVDSLQVGDLLDDEGQLPLVWSRVAKKHG